MADRDIIGIRRPIHELWCGLGRGIPVMGGGDLKPGSLRLANLRGHEFGRQAALQINQAVFLGNGGADPLGPLGGIHLGFPGCQLEADHFSGLHHARTDRGIERVGVGQRDDEHGFVGHAGLGVECVARRSECGGGAELRDQGAGGVQIGKGGGR